MGSSASCLNGDNQSKKVSVSKPSPLSIIGSTTEKKYHAPSSSCSPVKKCKEADIKALRELGGSGSTIVSAHRGEYDSDRETVKLSESANHLQGEFPDDDIILHRSYPPQHEFTGCCNLFDEELLDKADFLSRNAWDRQVFIRYILGDFWRGRVSPQLRKELAISAQWLKTNSMNMTSLNTGSSSPTSGSSPSKRSSQYNHEVDEVSSHLSNFNIEDLQQIIPMPQCQSLLIATVLNSFFVFRREVDFNVVLEENAPTLPSSIKGLTVDDDTHTIHDHLYEENGQFFLDPEHILSMIGLSSSPEDLDKLLMHAQWLQHLSSALESMQVSFKVVELSKLSKGPLIDDTSDSTSLPSLSYGWDPLLVFENPYHQTFANSLSPDSFSKIQAKNAISELKATKGYVVLNHQDERLPKTHFYASLPVPYAMTTKTSSRDRDMTDEDTVTQSTVAKDCRYVITAYHKFSGMQYEKSTVRMIDFFLLAIGAILLPPSV